MFTPSGEELGGGAAQGVGDSARAEGKISWFFDAALGAVHDRQPENTKVVLLTYANARQKQT